VQARLHLPADQHLTQPESGICRALYDCPDQLLSKTGKRGRLIVATHPAGAAKSRVGVTRSGVVYELLLTDLPQNAFTAADGVSLYLHRGAFENALADEDAEQDPDRWCSHSAWGQEAWHSMSQWVWNLRLERGHQLHSEPVRPTAFAPAHLSPTAQQALSPAPAQGYGPATEALPWKADRFSGRDFVPQPDGTLRCPAGQSLRIHERRVIRRWQHRRACMQLLAGQRLEVQMAPPLSASPDVSPSPLSRAQRAHARLSFQERLARNARAPTAGRVTISLFGVPEDFACWLGLPAA
jgi:hypothetical protein